VTLRPEQDAFGLVLSDLLAGKQAMTVVERDDGYIDSEDSSFYLRGVRRWPDVERQALRYVRGRVLDVGTGAGRVALELQRRGRRVVGIDVSPRAARIARKRGVEDVRMVQLEKLDDSLGRFDTVVMFGNNLGLLGSRAKAKRILRRLHALTTEQGRIVGTNHDPHRTKDPVHRAYARNNRARGRLPGQIRLRLRYRRLTSPWIDWLFVSPRELEQLLEGTGWRVRRILQGERFYAAVIEKEPRPR
jgi:SAM-dependent methyltransferase